MVHFENKMELCVNTSPLIIHAQLCSGSHNGDDEAYVCNRYMPTQAPEEDYSGHQ